MSSVLKFFQKVNNKIHIYLKDFPKLHTHTSFKRSWDEIQQTDLLYLCLGAQVESELACSAVGIGTH